MDSPVLLARELRWQTRLGLVRGLGRPLISVTLRAPSRLRRERDYHAAFELLCLGLERLFAGENTPLECLMITMDAEGPACHYAAADAYAAKRLCIRYEEESPGGGLLDIDLMDAQARPLSRQDIGLPARACLVCGARPAAACIAGRKHGEEETGEAFDKLLRPILDAAQWPQRVADHALRSLLYEVSVTPKPGLVDREGPGAHRDMDYYSFLDSAVVLAPYFLRCAGIGRDSICPPDELLSRLRPPGLEAEEAMRRAAKGANTHKGLIFSLGILCAASGILGEGADSDALCELAARIAAPALADVPDGSHGGHVRRRFGVLGARGEAASGFPAARAALPVLRESLDRGEDIDRAGVKALLSLMAELEDTNVLWRSGKEGLELTQNGARALLDRDVPTEALRRFDGELTARGISPGGSADLLAIVFFLHLNT